MSLLEMENIHYQTNDRLILDIKHISIHKGQRVGIMGPNGSGKTTILKVLSLLEAPSDGIIQYNGQVVDSRTVPLEMRRSFSIVMQQSLLFNATVYQNVATGLKWRGIDKFEIDKKVHYWLERFRISHLAYRHASKLSGGEAQRVNLARALILEPEILFLDEPFSALDYPTKIDLIDELREIIGETGMTVVFVSHDLQEIKFITDTVWIMVDGRIEQKGSTLDVIDKPNEATHFFIDKLKRFYY